MKFLKQARFLTPQATLAAAALLLAAALPESQAGPRYCRGGYGGFGGYGWGGGRSFAGCYSGPRFYSGYSCRPAYYGGCSPSYYSGYYGNYGYGSYRSYCPEPFPYYTPRIYVVPQPPRYYTGPAYRNVIVLSQPVSEIEALTIPPAAGLSQVLPPPALTEPVTAENAWRELEEGNAKAALKHFAVLAGATPENAAHKVGYGLSAALAGDKITATYALRLAFETDPNGADAAPIGGPLEASLRPLAAQYRQAMLKRPKDLNLRFLYVTVSHFIQDDAAVLNSVVDSIALGDTTASTANLRQLVERGGQRPAVAKAAALAADSTQAARTVE